MEQANAHHMYQLAILLIVIAAVFTLLSKKIKQPYPIVLVVIGAIIGVTKLPVLMPLVDVTTNSHFFNFVIISVFLPTLLGEATLKLPFHHLAENKKPILLLAIGGTLLSFLIVGLAGYYLMGLSLTQAFTFAALMSATDPVSVISIFKTLGVNKRLTTIIEGESLFNDGIAVVLFNISAFKLVAYMEMGWLGIGYGLWDFVYVVAGGLLVGSIFGYVFSKIISWFDDYPLEIIFSMVTFYGAFWTGEHIHVSGVIAVVVAGLIFGNYGGKIGMSPTTKTSITSFWDTIALLANCLVFLMVGLEIAVIDWEGKWVLIVSAVVIVIIARSIAIYVSLLTTKEVPTAWKHILNWGGLKGSLSIALVLSLPSDFRGRETILILAFSVVLVSLIFQGLTIPTLIKKLGVKTPGNNREEYETALSELYRCKAGYKHIQSLRENGSFSIIVLKQLEKEYQERIQQAEEHLQSCYKKYPELESRQKVMAEEQLLYAEFQAIEKLSSDHHISDDVASEMKERIMDSMELKKHEEK